MELGGQDGRFTFLGKRRTRLLPVCDVYCLCVCDGGGSGAPYALFFLMHSFSPLPPLSLMPLFPCLSIHNFPSILSLQHLFLSFFPYNSLFLSFSFCFLHCAFCLFLSSHFSLLHACALFGTLASPPENICPTHTHAYPTLTPATPAFHLPSLHLVVLHTTTTCTASTHMPTTHLPTMPPPPPPAKLSFYLPFTLSPTHTFPTIVYACALPAYPTCLDDMPLSSLIFSGTSLLLGACAFLAAACDVPWTLGRLDRIGQLAAPCVVVLNYLLE